MKKEQWQNDWQGLTRKVTQEPCPEALGFDLHRGKLLDTRSVLNAFHLQVFGQDIFLRNMMQRILETDIVQKSRRSPIIIIVPDNREEILEEINKIFASKTPYGANSLLFYTHARSGRSVSLERALNLFELKTQTHLFMQLEVKYRPLDNPLLSHLSKEIKEKFRSEILVPLAPDQPFIYLFCPEDMGTQDHVIEYIKGLKTHVCFRVFSKHTVSLFDDEESGLVYGPELYSVEMYKKMRRHFYWHLKQQRKWDKEKNFYGDRENSKILRWVKNSVAGIAENKTAFGRFRSPYGRGWEYFWFYPIPQNLGSLPYIRPPKTPDENNVSKPAGPEVSSQVQDPLLEIINDLKPKNEDSKKELC